jgi:hypothetical protein
MPTIQPGLRSEGRRDPAKHKIGNVSALLLEFDRRFQRLGARQILYFAYNILWRMIPVVGG